MKILAIDTTYETCSVAIGENDRLTCCVYLHNKNTHSVNLLPLIDDCLKIAALDIDDIDAYAVSTGPGSFTGIRIGVCTIKGFALSKQKPCIDVNALDALSENSSTFVGKICALVDARRQECYFAYFNSDGTNVERISEYGADKLENILEDISDDNVCFVGDGAIQYKQMIKDVMQDNCVFAKETNIFQNAVGVLNIAFKKAKNDDFVSAYDISAYYHRVSQAERMKNANG